jgi:CHAT domain-containing protein/tetratricopeptide (TPR) repeat protein
MNPMEHSAFPSDETLAAFIDGRLDEETRKKVVAHVADCEDCYGTVMAAMSWRPEDQMPQLSAESPRRRLITGLLTSSGVAAAISLVFFGASLRDSFNRFDYQRRTGIRALVGAANEIPYRPAEARLAGGFPYKPTRETDRSAGDKPQPAWQIVAAAGEVGTRAEKSKDVNLLHGLGVAQLELEKDNDALETLERAIKLQTNETSIGDAIQKSTDAQLLSDLAASLYTHGRQADEGRSLMIAIEAADRSLALQNGRSPEAAWNRALIIEGSGPVHEAIRAWETYLRLDPKSSWSNEAREHVERLRRSSRAAEWVPARLKIDETGNALQAGFGQELRGLAEQLLIGWSGAAVTEGDASASVQSPVPLAELQAIAASFQASGDDLLADTLSSLIRRGSAKARDAFRAYASGTQLYTSGQLVRATSAFQEADRLLQDMGNPFSLVASHQAARCICSEMGASACTDALRRLRSRVSGHRYPSLLARIDWAEATTLSIQGRPVEATELYLRALRAFDRLHENENVATIHCLLGTALSGAGDSDAALAHYVSAMRLTPWIRENARRHDVFSEIALILIQQNCTAAASVVLDEISSDVTRAEDAAVIALLRGVISLRRGNSGAAGDSFRRARQSLAAVPDEQVKKQIDSFLILAESGLRRISSNGESVDEVNRALSIYVHRDNAVWTSELLYERGRIRELKGDVFGAEADYVKAADCIARRQPRLDQALFGIGMPTDALAPFAGAVRLFTRRGAVGEALILADRANALRYSPATALDARVADPYGAWSIGDVGNLLNVQAHLRRTTVLAENFIAGDSLYTWLLTPDRLTVSVRKVTLAELSASIDEFRSAVVESKPTSRTLARIVIDPWLASVPSDAEIVFVSAPQFAGVAFSALPLFDGSPLIVRNAVATAPTLGVFASAQRNDDLRRTNEIKAAFVAVASDGTQPVLHSATEEAIQAASLYSKPAVLTGLTATRDNFLAVAGGATVIQYSGHSIINERRPLLSALTFSGSADADRYLYVHDVNRKTFPSARLVVVASCSTAKQPQPGMSVGGALLSQNVPSVVAALWLLDDRAAAAFSYPFHDAIVHGMSRAEAVRRAQLQMLKGPSERFRQSRYWAALELAGATGPII